jgi:HSP20 family protein
MLTPSFGRLSDFMREMQQEMDQMMRLLPVGPSLSSDLLSPAGPVGDLARLSMNVDIREDDKNYYISADVPGLRKDDIKIRVDGNHLLTITGQRKEERDEKDDQGNVQRVERVVGTYVRQFQLPDNIDPDHIQAKVDHGVLKLTIPKNEEAAKPREIPVE